MAGLDIKGRQPVTAVAAVIIGTLVVEEADQSDDRAFAVGMVASGVLTVDANHTGTFVAVFFCASRCW